MTLAQCNAIERDFKQYHREKTVGKVTPDDRNVFITMEADSKPIKLNYNDCKMTTPIAGKVTNDIERTS